MPVACPRCRRRDDVPRDTANDRAAHARRHCRRTACRCTRSRLSRGRGSLRHQPGRGRSGTCTAAEQPGRTEARSDHPRRRSRNSQQARSSVSGALARRGATTTRHEPPSRRPPCRLPLAGTRTHCRARWLPLSQLAPLMGTGPASRARGAGPRRRVPPLHLRRRFGATRAHARRTSHAPSGRQSWLGPLWAALGRIATGVRPRPPPRSRSGRACGAARRGARGG